MKAVKIKQRDMTDCGAACLASVAAYHKLKIPVSRIRQLASTDKKGTNLLGMIEAAKAIGFDARGVRGEMQSLSQIPKPAIAHVVVKEVLHHYVVIYEVTVKHIQVMDPGDGLLHQYSFEEFRKIWSGITGILVAVRKLFASIEPAPWPPWLQKVSPSEQEAVRLPRILPMPTYFSIPTEAGCTTPSIWLCREE